MKNKSYKGATTLKKQLVTFLFEKSIIEIQIKKLNEMFKNDDIDVDMLNNNVSLKAVFSAMENLPNDKVLKTLEYINPEDIIKFINENEEDTIIPQMLDCVAKFTTNKTLVKFLNEIKSDRIRAELLIRRPDEEEVLLPFIEDPYYKSAVLKSKTRVGAWQRYDIIEDLKAYELHREKLKQIEDDDSKAKYIAKLEDNNMKIVLLSQIDDRDNRKTVIRSLERRIGPHIRNIDDCAQTMIKEYFKDMLENLSEQQQEKLAIVLNSTSVDWGELEPNINGRTYIVSRRIVISNQYENHLNIILGMLLHEYGHACTELMYPFTGLKPNYEINEGMADLFSDVILNHYLKKHGQVKIKGIPIRVDNPYENKSGYSFEAAWPRTILAGLESKGKDKEAFIEYFLGDRVKFYQMALGKDNPYVPLLANKKVWKKDSSDEVDFGKLFRELYYSPELDFTNINEESIYYKRNYILPAYILQNKLGDKADIVGVLQEGKQYDVGYIADKLFDGKKFFEIPRDQLENFTSLLDKQTWPKMLSPIGNIERYGKDEIRRVTPEDTKNHSFEILDNIVALAGGKSIIRGMFMEDVIDKATGNEISKIYNGQPLEVTKKKKDSIVERYKKTFVDNSENMFILDNIKDYEFYCEQFEKSFKDEESPKKSEDIDIE